MGKDLRSFLKQLREKAPDELVRVRREVDPNLELCGVLRQLQERGQYPVVLFDNVKGTQIPVVGNLLGSRSRLALALETTDEGLTLEYAKRQEALTPPIVVEKAPVKEVIMRGAEVDMHKLPNIVHCGGDGGPYISSGVVIAKDPDTGVNNAGIYRIQIKGKNKLGIWPGDYSHMELIRRKWERLGKPTEVAIAIGHHPGLYLGAQYRGPMDVDELEVTGGLLGEPLRIVACETVDLAAPADAEIVIEGRILPGEREYEGPFGEYTWYLGPAVADNPVIQITAITHRADAIYQDLFSAHPEHNLCGLLGREAMVFKRVQAAIPTVKAVSLPFSGTCRHAVYVSIKKEFDGAGRNAALSALAADPFMKLAVVVDDDINVFNETEVMWAVVTRVQADRDVFAIPDAYVCELDPSAYDVADRSKRGALNSKWAIDATKPVALPFQERADVPEEVWKGINLEQYLQPYQ